jgi:hypothetical protein
MTGYHLFLSPAESFQQDFFFVYKPSDLELIYTKINHPSEYQKNQFFNGSKVFF